MNRKTGREAGRSPANMTSHQREQECDYYGIPFGDCSMLASYIVIAKTNSKYGYISRGRAFFKGHIGYIRLHRA